MPTNINGNTGIDKVQDGTVVSADIDTLDASKLTGSIAAARIANNTIDSAHIASGAVDDAHLATGITASKLTGTIADARFPSTLPAASAANLTAIPAANITGTLPAISAANLTAIPAANLTGTLPAISGANLTNLPSADVSVDSWHLSLNSTTDVSSNVTIDFSTRQHLGSNVSEAGGEITVGTAGMYLVSYSAVCPGAPNRGFNVNLYKNSTLIDSTYIHSGADSYSGWGVTVNLQLAANDVIKVYGTGHFYGNSQAMSRFIGTRIGA